jgi:hypothetical protein
MTTLPQAEKLVADFFATLNDDPAKRSAYLRGMLSMWVTEFPYVEQRIRALVKLRS